MTYFAKIENGIVVNVIIADQAFVDAQPGLWIETFPDRSQRKNYASKGDSWDALNNRFLKPKLFASWTLNENSGDWEPPIPKPNDGNDYEWHEQAKKWRKV